MTDELHNAECECAILGACFMDRQAIPIARSIVRGPSAFYTRAHQLLWSAMTYLADMETAIDPVTVSDRLNATGDLVTAGGKEFISELLDAVPTAVNVEHHAKIVRDFADRRELSAIAHRLMRNSQDRALGIAEIVADATNALTPVVVDSSASDFVSARDRMWSVLEHLERIGNGENKPGMTTGWPELDDKMGGGPVAGEMVSIVGIPGSGKTAMTVNWATHAMLDQGLACAFVSAEMRTRQLIIRQINMLGRVTTEETRSGKFQADGWARVVRAAGRLVADDLLFIDDTPAPAVEDVVAKVTQLKQRVPKLAYVFVDFLQLLKQRDRRRGDLESSELKAVAYALAAMGSKLGVVVVATVQPNDKQIEERADKRPMLRDIQGSSGIRQASHFVLLVHRPAQFDPNAGDLLEIEIGKARELAQGKVKLRWDGSHVRVHSAGRDALDELRERRDAQAGELRLERAL